MVRSSVSKQMVRLNLVSCGGSAGWLSRVWLAELIMLTQVGKYLSHLQPKKWRLGLNHDM